MIEILVIGIGTGNPEHMTVQAINALNRADVVLVPRKGTEKADLAELRREICRRFLTGAATRLVEFDLPRREDSGDYLGSVDAWHRAIAESYGSLLAGELGGGGTAALLVWGDPSLYDSTLRILEHVREKQPGGLRVTVIPGITSIQALAASHAMPLNTIGNPVLVTTGRKLREGVPDDVDTLVVMLDGEMSFLDLPADNFDIYWGAYLGLEGETIIAGPLADVADRIAQTRTQLRRTHGWIMDTYLLRRRRGGEAG